MESSSSRRMMEMPRELKEAMDRVLSLEQLELYDSLTHLLTLDNHNNHLDAAHIYVNEEEKTDEELQTIDERNKADEVDELHDALLNHQLVRHSLQQASLKIQMLEAVSQKLAKVDLTDTVENFPVTGTLIGKVYGNGLSCSELAGLLEKKRNLDLDILQQRVKYTNLVSNITNKWKAIDNLTLTDSTHNPQVKKQITKLHERECKLQLLVSMLQGLVCNSGIHWGQHQYFITMLKMCDSIIKNSSTEEQNKYIKELPQLRENMILFKDENKKGQKKEDVKKFFTKSLTQKQ
ncbi:hypothetical protein Pcinc_021003 [Petrolisthes cinctipes]|uniref:Centromere protein H C-terminal domain-containing protein n=1 Tax=Petrolisthes cinctipes TaxID=88211 RepID=A0AAE1KI91_PETCI|nr:hypothetical protein Pcinc_021003 [Petrolisthes cinctipes]